MRLLMMLTCMNQFSMHEEYRQIAISELEDQEDEEEDIDDDELVEEDRIDSLISDGEDHDDELDSDIEEIQDQHRDPGFDSENRDNNSINNVIRQRSNSQSNNQNTSLPSRASFTPRLVSRLQASSSRQSSELRQEHLDTILDDDVELPSLNDLPTVASSSTPRRDWVMGLRKQPQRFKKGKGKERT